MKRYSLPVVLLVCVLSGCAAVIVERATPDSKNGVRYYRPDMYVLVSYEVTSECVVNVKTEFRPLPNKKEEYIVRSRVGIGTVTLNPTLTDGWNLTAFSSTVDSKVPETITALTGVGSAIAAAVAPGAAMMGADPSTKAPVNCGKQVDETRPRRGLYRITYDDTTGHVNGFVGPIRMP